MQQRAVAGFRFQRVRKGVPEIQQCAFAVLVFVTRHDSGLVSTTARDRFTERRGVTSIQCVDVLFEPDEEAGIAYRAVFDDFGKPCAVFARRQCGQGVRIDHDGARLMERADQVLAGGEVHAGLAAH